MYAKTNMHTGLSTTVLTKKGIDYGSSSVLEMFSTSAKQGADDDLKSLGTVSTEALTESERSICSRDTQDEKDANAATLSEEKKDENDDSNLDLAARGYCVLAGARTRRPAACCPTSYMVHVFEKESLNRDADGGGNDFSFQIQADDGPAYVSLQANEVVESVRNLTEAGSASNAAGDDTIVRVHFARQNLMVSGAASDVVELLEDLVAQPKSSSSPIKVTQKVITPRTNQKEASEYVAAGSGDNITKEGFSFDV